MHEQRRYTELYDKYKEVKLSVQTVNHKNRDLEAMHDKTIPVLKEELRQQTDLYQTSAKGLLDCKEELFKLKTSSAATEAALILEIDSLKRQLASEIGETMNRDILVKEYESQLVDATKALSSTEKELDVVSKKVEELKLDMEGFVDQFLELNYFGPSVYPTLPTSFAKPYFRMDRVSSRRN